MSTMSDEPKPQQSDNRPRKKDGTQDVEQDPRRDYSRFPHDGLSR
jgi:hypothetical protein